MSRRGSRHHPTIAALSNQATGDFNKLLRRSKASGLLSCQCLNQQPNEALAQPLKADPVAGTAGWLEEEWLGHLVTRRLPTGVHSASDGQPTAWLSPCLEQRLVTRPGRRHLCACLGCERLLPAGSGVWQCSSGALSLPTLAILCCAYCKPPRSVGTSILQ